MEVITKYFTEKNKRESSFLSGLKNIIKKSKVEKDCIVVKVDDITNHSKVKLRKIIADHSDGLIILCTYNPKVLIFSAGIPVFHGCDLSDWRHGMKGLKFKLTLLKRRINDEVLMFYHDGDTINLKLNNISCIKGSGSYCRIYAHEKKCYLVTMRIKEIREKIGDVNMLFDVNRSIIVNINRIAAVKKQSVIFRGTPKYVLKMGYRSVKKVRDELLWNNDIKI